MRVAVGEIQVEQGAAAADVDDEERVNDRSEQVDVARGDAREDEGRAEKNRRCLAEHPQCSGHSSGAPPMSAHQPGAAAHRVSDRSVLEQDLLLGELPVDELDDGDRDPDDRHREQDQRHEDQQLDGEQSPEAMQHRLRGHEQARILAPLEVTDEGDHDRRGERGGDRPTDAERR